MTDPKVLRELKAALRKENADLHTVCDARAKYKCEDKETLVKVKEIIKKLIALYFSPIVTNDDLQTGNKIITEAKQFIGEAAGGRTSD